MSRFDPEQGEQIERVRERIGRAVLAFFAPPRETYRSCDLYDFVKDRLGKVAPASVNRIACLLRGKRLIDFRCTHRAGSLYEIIRHAPLDPQLPLF
jgi:hypothetical protein